MSDIGNMASALFYLIETENDCVLRHRLEHTANALIEERDAAVVRAEKAEAALSRCEKERDRARYGVWLAMQLHWVSGNVKMSDLEQALANEPENS